MPGIRENVEDRLSPELIIDEEFAGLIPPLTPDELSGLEQSIIAEGCREAIIVWNGVIVDGHNRYRICRAHDIPYMTERREFASRDEAMLWMLRNQLGRRNLNDFQRVEMVRKCEGAVKAQAEKRKSPGTNQYTERSREKLPATTILKGRATDELGTLAGVSRKTYEHATAVLDEAPAPVVEATRKKELSINTAYNVTKMPKTQQAEIAQRIQGGENPKAVIASVQSSTVAGLTTQEQYKTTPVYYFEMDKNLYLEHCPEDCILCLWVKPYELAKAISRFFGSGKGKFKYQGIASVWTYGGEVQQLCIIGTRGEARLPQRLEARVIDAQPEKGDKRPEFFDELVRDLTSKER